MSGTHISSILRIFDSLAAQFITEAEGMEDTLAGGQ
jgi:hypothetical protein